MVEVSQVIEFRPYLIAVRFLASWQRPGVEILVDQAPCPVDEIRPGPSIFMRREIGMELGDEGPQVERLFPVPRHPPPPFVGDFIVWGLGRALHPPSVAVEPVPPLVDPLDDVGIAGYCIPPRRAEASATVLDRAGGEPAHHVVPRKVAVRKIDDSADHASDRRSGQLLRLRSGHGNFSQSELIRDQCGIRFLLPVEHRHAVEGDAAARIRGDVSGNASDLFPRVGRYRQPRFVVGRRARDPFSMDGGGERPCHVANGVVRFFVASDAEHHSARPRGHERIEHLPLPPREVVREVDDHGAEFG